jgi:hypothetical protein
MAPIVILTRALNLASMMPSLTSILELNKDDLGYDDDDSAFENGFFRGVGMIVGSRIADRIRAMKNDAFGNDAPDYTPKPEYVTTSVPETPSGYPAALDGITIAIFAVSAVAMTAAIASFVFIFMSRRRNGNHIHDASRGHRE